MLLIKCPKNLFLYGIVLLMSTFLSAQDYQKLESIKSQGKIPSDFYTLSSEKFKSQSQVEIKQTDKRKIAKSKEGFLIKSNFILDDLLTSGDVLFNDSLTVYINKVADEILKNKPQLRSQIHFYVVKSPHVNAFSTSQGYVLVNIGLLAQIENEAQLAFILCHEIIHYTKKHAISQKVNYDTEIKKEKSNSYDKMLAYSAYSKDLESEADVEGLELYMDTKYSKNVFDNVFDVLKYSYLPFDEVPYKYDYLETSLFKIRKECKLDTVNSISLKNDEDDELSTHPNIDKRIAVLKNKIKTYTITQKGDDFILGDQYFKRISYIARHELSQLFLEEKNYGASIYNSFLLLEVNPKDVFAKVQTLNTLYLISKYANRGELYNVIKSSSDIEGESHRVYYLFENMSNDEINIMALNYAYKLKLELKDDKFVEGICDDLINELIEQNDLRSSDFNFKSTTVVLEESSKKKAQINEGKEEVSSTEISKKSKYDKIKELESKIEEREIDSSFSKKNAFSDICYNDAFEKRFKQIEKKYLDKLEYQKTSSYKDAKQKAIKLNLKKGYALGLDKVIVVDPEYYKIDERKKESVEYMDAEIYKSNNKEIIVEMAKKVDLKIDYLNPTDMTTNDIVNFNDMALLNRWLKERSLHDFQMTSIYQREIDELAKRKNVNTATWMGTVSVHIKKEKVGLKIFYSTLVPYFWPLIPIIIFKQEYKTYFYNVSYNLSTGDKVLVEFKEFKTKDLKSVLKSNAYESMAQLKAKRK